MIKKHTFARETKKSLSKKQPETYDVLYARPCGLRKFNDFPRIFFSSFPCYSPKKIKNVAVEKLFVRTLRKIVFFYLEKQNKNRIDEVTRESKQKKTQEVKLK